MFCLYYNINIMPEGPQNADDASNRGETPNTKPDVVMVPVEVDREAIGSLGDAIRTIGKSPMEPKLLEQVVKKTTEQPLAPDALQIIEKSKDKEKEDAAAANTKQIMEGLGYEYKGPNAGYVKKDSPNPKAEQETNKAEAENPSNVAEEFEKTKRILEKEGYEYKGPAIGFKKKPPEGIKIAEPPPNLPVEDAQPIAEDKAEGSPALFEFPQRMLNLKEYSPADDPRPYPPELRGLPPTNPDVRAEIERRKAEFETWKRNNTPTTHTTIAEPPTTAAEVTAPTTSAQSISPEAQRINQILSGVPPEQETISPEGAQINTKLGSASMNDARLNAARQQGESPTQAEGRVGEPPEPQRERKSHSPEASKINKILSGTSQEQKTVESKKIDTGKGKKKTGEEKSPEEQRIEAEKRQKTREMLYCMTTGKKTAADMPPDYAPSEKVMKEGMTVYERKGRFIDYAEKEAKAREVVRKSKEKEGKPALAEATIWKENAWKSFEKSMDGLKVEMLKDFLARKKAEFPELTKKELSEEAIKFSSTFVIEAATNMYTQLETETQERVLSTQERSLVKRMTEGYLNMSKRKRIMMSAAIGAGSAAAIAVSFGGAGALAVAGIAGSRAIRSVAGGGIGAGLQSIYEKITGRKYGAKREEARLEQHGKTEAMLKAETQKDIEEGVEWLKDQEKLLALMTLVDNDARAYKGKLDEINARERKSNRRGAIVSGLIGGALANIDNIAHWFGYGGTGPKVGVIPLERHADVIPSGKLAEAGDKLADAKIITVERGSSFWSTTRQFVKNGSLTNEQYADAWQHSEIPLTVGGHTKMIPISEMGLVHPGKQVEAVIDAAGRARFVVQDTVKDHIFMGDNITYAEALRSAGKPVPEWLERAVEIKQGVRSPVEEATAAIHHVESPIFEVPQADTVPVISKSEMVYDSMGQLQVQSSFKTSSLLDQEHVLGKIADQTDELKSMMSTGQTQQMVDFASHNYYNTESLRYALATAPEYQTNIQILHQTLIDHDIAPKFFERIGGVKVRDLLDIDTGHGADAVDQLYPTLRDLTPSQTDQLHKLATIVAEKMPGRIEKGMTTADFIKSSIQGGQA